MLLAVGVEYKWFLDDFYVVHPDQQYYINLAPSGMIVIGASICFMAVFGYWAAKVENNCMLTMVRRQIQTESDFYINLLVFYDVVDDIHLTNCFGLNGNSTNAKF